MSARLKVFFPHQPTRIFPLADDRRHSIGRDPSSDLVLEDPRISRHHARVERHGTAWLLRDLDSKNGVEVDGRKVAEAELSSEAWLSFGGLLAHFEVLSAEARRSELEFELGRRQTSLNLQHRLDPAVGLDPLLRQVLRSVLDLTEAERGFILLMDAEGELELTSSVGVDEAEFADPSFAGSVGALDRALKINAPVVFSDVQGDIALGGRPSIVAGGIRALICLPLVVMEQPIGLVYADSRQPGSHFTELDVEILCALAAHAALAISVARLHDEMVDLQVALPQPKGTLQGRASAWKHTLKAHARAPSNHRPLSTTGSTWSRLLIPSAEAEADR